MSTGFNQGNYILSYQIEKDKMNNPENADMLT